MQKDISL